MSSTTINPTQKESATAANIEINSTVLAILRLLGSLRITVWGFALAIVILFLGTLAQDEETIVDVKRDYFNSWVAYVPLHVLVPITIWPEEDFGRLPWGIVLPGGATIGLVLLINLIAAKLTRFHMTAKGARLVAGLAFCLVGATITAVVILGAHAEDGLQGEPPFSYDLLWEIVRAAIVVSAIGLGVWWSVHKFTTTLGSITTLVVACGMALWSLSVLIYPDVLRIPDPGLRIVWQMSKSLIAGGILLVGLNLLFGIRGGNVLIHLSVGLLMLGQFIFGDRQIEERIILAENETTSVAFRPEEIELAFVDESSPDKNRVIAIDERAIISASRYGNKIVDANLPFQIAVKKYFYNADLVSVKDDKAPKENLATQGIGREYHAVNVIKTGGAKEDRNYPAAYVELFDKDGKEWLGTYMVSLQINDFSRNTYGIEEDIVDTVVSSGQSYRMGMRYRRSYKDYVIGLTDFQNNEYANSNMTRDFSSYVKFNKIDGSEPLEGRIWMNNPMRYRGETFYQSSFVSAEKVGVDMTELQVVRNAGWLLPYIACAFAGLGMLGHFGTTFVRFAARFDRERSFGTMPSEKSNHTSKAKTSEKKKDQNPFAVTNSGPTTKQATSIWADAADARRGTSGWLLPLVVVCLVGALFGYYAAPKKPKTDEFDWYAAGQVPVQHEGRIKPFDSVARNTLQALSGRTSTVVRAGDNKSAEDLHPKATEWFMSLLAGEEWVHNAKVFRIDAKEVLDVFGLEASMSGGTIGPRQMLFGQTGRQRYSWNQLEPKMDEFRAKVRPILDKQMKNKESLRFVDQKFLELFQKINIYELSRLAYSTHMPRMPEDENDESARAQFSQQLMGELQMVQELESGNPPGMIPPLQANVEGADKSRWRSLRPALFTSYASRAFGMTEFQDSPALMPLLDVVDAVRDGKADRFNDAIREYRRVLSTISTASSVMPKAGFEAWYNKFGAVSGCVAMYSMASVFAFLSFIVFPQSLRRIAFWIAVTTFVVHVFALIGRIYITERAPVINLYSSAVYIGCGAVLFGLVIEYLFPIRIGMLVGTLIGGTTLLVAHGLDTSDTMPVLQAVLDTQFWLTTHVQCISLGYLATFVAGGLAIGSIIHRGVHRNQLSQTANETDAHLEQRILFRITYGVICFAIFFSFIGTVLGGLWADDSWGRFWGWDPKENGALMIVLWNAIVLHARWDKLVRERGFAMLCVGGNIITAWSWFGTNQLGIGLHSYGFTSSVLQILGWFVLSQLLIVAYGWLFTSTNTPPVAKTSSQREPIGSWE